MQQPTMSRDLNEYEMKEDQIPGRVTPTPVKEEQELEQEECAICLCLLSFDSNVHTLDNCSHRFHCACIQELKAKCAAKNCPLCRAPLQSSLFQSPEERYEESIDRYTVLEERVLRGVTSWSNLSVEEKLEFDDILNIWRDTAENGNATAMFNLGLMYRRGRGFQKNNEMAVYWYHKAALQGHLDAQNNLGFMHNHQHGTHHTTTLEAQEEAVYWYRMAADQGFGEAQFNMGVMCRHGRGTQMDLGEALYWYNLAAMNGSIQASQAILQLGRIVQEEANSPQGSQQSNPL